MLSQTLLMNIVAEGGITFDLHDHSHKRVGYAVAIHPERSMIIPLTTIRPDDVDRYLKQNLDLLVDASSPNCFGAWLDDGLIYLDISTVVDDFHTAAVLALQYGQKAIYSLHEDREYGRADILAAALELERV